MKVQQQCSHARVWTLWLLLLHTARWRKVVTPAGALWTGAMMRAMQVLLKPLHGPLTGGVHSAAAHAPCASCNADTTTPFQFG